MVYYVRRGEENMTKRILYVIALILLYGAMTFMLVPSEVEAPVVMELPTIMEITELHIKELPIVEEVVEEVKVVQAVEVVQVVEKPKVVAAPEENDLYWLSRIISAEARGESVEGQIAVGNVVMNRVRSNQFPNSIKGVIFQKGQFSPVMNGSIHKSPTQTALESARKVLDGQVVVSNDALYFYSPKYTGRSNWIRSRTIVREIGTHRFAK